MPTNILSRAFPVCYNAILRRRSLSGAVRWVLYKQSFLTHLYNKFFLQPSLPDHDLVIDWDGQRIFIENPRRNIISQSLFLRGVWEPEVTEFITARIGPGMTAIDVGADTGYYTLLFAKRVGKLGRVVAFEPIPSARGVLEDNLRLNNYTNVTISDVALFSINGTMTLDAPRDLSRIAPNKTHSHESAIEIQTRVFDECVAELQLSTIDLVKIDVEGAELNVLLGMRGSIEEYHPALLIEIHPQHLAHFDHNVEDLIELLKNMKYRLTPVDKPLLDFTKDNVTAYCTQT